MTQSENQKPTPTSNPGSQSSGSAVSEPSKAGSPGANPVRPAQAGSPEKPAEAGAKIPPKST